MLRREKGFIAGFLKWKRMKGFRLLKHLEKKKKKVKIWLLHFHFGHPNFMSFKLMFPKPSARIEPLSSQCQIFEMSKSHHVLYPLSNKRS